MIAPPRWALLAAVALLAAAVMVGRTNPRPEPDTRQAALQTAPGESLAENLAAHTEPGVESPGSIHVQARLKWLEGRLADLEAELRQERRSHGMGTEAEAEADDAGPVRRPSPSTPVDARMRRLEAGTLRLNRGIDALVGGTEGGPR